MMRLYKYNKILAFMLALAFVVSLFSFSVSAEGVNVPSDFLTVEDTQLDNTVMEDASMEQTNEYLRYITGFLLFICIYLLIKAVYRILSIFF